MTQILIAQEVEYLSNEVADQLMEEANHTKAMLKKLIRSRQQIQKEKNREPYAVCRKSSSLTFENHLRNLLIL